MLFRTLLSCYLVGWAFSEATGSKLDMIKPTSRGSVTIFGVPYSEHSSFNELRDFVKVCFVLNILSLPVKH